MPTSVDTSNLAFAPLISRVANDAKAIRCIGVIDFSIDSIWNLSLTAKVSQWNLQHGIQSVWIDCRNVPVGVVALTCNTTQTIAVPANTQGFYPLIVTADSWEFVISNPVPITIPSLGTTKLDLIFMNVPYVASQWYTVSLAPGGSGGGDGFGLNTFGTAPFGDPQT